MWAAIIKIGIVPFWKTVSIVLTGLFGIFGLLTEYRDKSSGRLTKWGWISVLGIACSATTGAAVQWIEIQDDAAKAKAAAVDTLNITKSIQQTVDNSGVTLNQIDRLFTRLGSSPTIEFYLSSSCKIPYWRPICQTLPVTPQGEVATHRARIGTPLHILVHIGRISSQPYKGWRRIPRTFYRLNIDATKGQGVADVIRHRDNSLVVYIEAQASVDRSNGLIALDDLPGLTVTVSSFDRFFRNATLDFFNITAENGQTISFDQDIEPVKPWNPAWEDRKQATLFVQAPVPYITRQ